MPHIHTFTGGPLDGQTVTTRSERSSLYRDSAGKKMTAPRGDKVMYRHNRGRKGPSHLVPGIYWAHGTGYVWHPIEPD